MNDFNLTTPVAFIIFNRPDTTMQVFERIREVKPSNLLIIADGPRQDKPGESEKCQQCRDIIKNIDWTCNVLTNYSDVNLGTKIRVSSGLNWVFENVEKAIVLEDDCLPDLTFFPFCQELLDLYKNDEKIMAISGTNLLYGTGKMKRNNNKDYYFSRISGNWGWATWKRAWQKYDITMQSWPKNKEQKLLTKFFEKNTVKFWENIFQKTYEEKIITAWDYQWYYTILSNDGFCIMPHGNLIRNIGFGEGATNTFDGESEFANLKIERVNLPLNGFTEAVVNHQYDKLMNQYFYKVPTISARIKSKIINLIK